MIFEWLCADIWLSEDGNQHGLLPRAYPHVKQVNFMIEPLSMPHSIALNCIRKVIDSLPSVSLDSTHVRKYKTASPGIGIAAMTSSSFLYESNK